MAWKLFREGWRPTLGWVVVLAVLQEFVIRHWLGQQGSDPAQLLALVTLSLGHVGARTVEKIKGVAQ